MVYGFCDAKIQELAASMRGSTMLRQLAKVAQTGMSSAAWLELCGGDVTVWRQPHMISGTKAAQGWDASKVVSQISQWCRSRMACMHVLHGK